MPPNAKHARRVLIGLAGVIIVAVAFGGSYTFQRKLIYLPSPGPVPGAAQVLPGGRDVTLATSDGLRLGAWFFPATAATASVLVAPGNAGDRSLRVPLASALLARGLSVLLFDYRGYAGNPGEPTESGLALDVRAARDWLLGEIGQARLLYYGESLGAAVVTELSVEHPPAGVILRSPFTELAAVGRYHYPFLPVRWLLQDRYPVSAQVSRIRAPITVVYGTSDSVVPAQQSREVATIAGARGVEVPGADHNDPALLNGTQLIDAVVDHAEQLR
jgi:fermentation-respiration switch protein FrsA (DUF1100 family)